MSKKTNGYKFDITKQTLTLSAAFAEAINDPTSEEYKLVRQFLLGWEIEKYIKFKYLLS